MIELLSVKEVADELRVQPRTVREYIRTGALRATRIGKNYRIRVQDLALFTRGDATLPAVGEEPGDAAPGARSHPASQATVILDIAAEDGLVVDRITTLVTAAGFAAGVDLHLSTIAGSAAMKIILTGPVGGVLDAAAAVRRVVGVTHE
ncbi:MAG: helix-turn-helix domain-containing protein [Leifsonia sp.]